MAHPIVASRSVSLCGEGIINLLLDNFREAGAWARSCVRGERDRNGRGFGAAVPMNAAQEQLVSAPEVTVETQKRKKYRFSFRIFSCALRLISQSLQKDGSDLRPSKADGAAPEERGGEDRPWRYFPH